jgi:hypothetical protein
MMGAIGLSLVYSCNDTKAYVLDGQSLMLKALQRDKLPLLPCLTVIDSRLIRYLAYTELDWSTWKYIYGRTVLYSVEPACRSLSMPGDHFSEVLHRQDGIHNNMQKRQTLSAIAENICWKSHPTAKNPGAVRTVVWVTTNGQVEKNRIIRK